MYRVNEWIEGQLGGFADMNNENETMFTFAALFAQMILGAVSINGMLDGLTVVADAGTFNVAVGGAGEACVISGRLATEIAATVLTVSANATGTIRTDLVVAKFIENAVDPISRPVRQTDGTVINTLVYQAAQSLEFEIVPGTGGTGIGTIPSGYVEVGRVVVPPEGATLGSGDAYPTLPTLTSVLSTLAVRSLNGLIGVLALTNDDGSITITPGDGIITLRAAASAANVASLNGLTGALNLTSPGGSISIETDGTNIVLTVVGTAEVLSLNGLTGNVEIEGGAGITVAVVGGNLVITNSLPATPIGNSYVAKQLFAAGVSPVTCALGALPAGGTYLLEAWASGFDFAASSSQSATLTGVVGSWDGTAGTDRTTYDRTLLITGTCGGGVAPKVQYVSTASELKDGQTVGIVLLRATRIT